MNTHEVGLRQAQTKIAKKLFENKYKETFIAEITELPFHEVIAVVYEDKIKEMLDEVLEFDGIAFILNWNLIVVLNAIFIVQLDYLIPEKYRKYELDLLMQRE